MENTVQRAERRPSGWRYVILGFLTFVFAGSLLMAGIVLGGGAAIMDRMLTGLGLLPAPAPTPTIVSGDAIVQQIRQISRLETTTYTVERVIEARQSDPVWPDWLRGDRLLLIANGTVVAGVDMEQVQPSDVVLSPDGKAVTITLPPAEIFNPNSIINDAKTRVYDRQQGLLTPTNENLETNARRAAAGQLLLAACQEGIMERATEDARETVTKMLSLFEMEATVVTRPPTPCPGT